MVLAAGLGSRLRPLTHMVPKPLVPVGDRPVLAHVLERLASAEIDRVVVNAHHDREKLKTFLVDHPAVALSDEPQLLGTAGGVAYAAALLGAGDVIVWNADILAALDLTALIASHATSRAGGPHRGATLVVQPRERGTGSVGLDPSGRVVRLRGERAGEEARGGEFLGIHVLGEKLRQTLPEHGCLVGDVYIPAMRSGVRLQAFEWREPFFDIGTVARYLEANRAWLSARRLRHWVGPGARLGSGVVLEGTVVGDGATVQGRGALERCVVWPGAAATAPLVDAVVAPGHIVRASPC
jgi:mannose-1-phosphate guanylyltransferase